MPLPSSPIAPFLAAQNPLAQHYSQFRVTERLLLTGHSHQAWPDCARRGHIAAYDDAAKHVDDKWSHAFVQADAVRSGFGQLLGCPPDQISLGHNTHELLARLLSALDWKRRTKILTTDAEFHSARRQLDRLHEAGIELVKTERRPEEPGVTALALAVDNKTAAVVVSSVAFSDGRICNDFHVLADACRAQGCALIVDAYHLLNVVPANVSAMGLSDAFVLGGGYKYCQLGEGNCFLRVPPECQLRPVYTGWYAEFGELEGPSAGRVRYAQGPGRFAGSTYDPTSHYRAAEVFRFFSEQGLTPELLRAVSQAQVARILEGLAGANLPPALVRAPAPTELTSIAGFVVFELASADLAQSVVAHCRKSELYLDSRGNKLRMGPAPYLSMAQIDTAVDILVASLSQYR